jgi:glyoxylase-like metal-dependent hydrolase (beta-lactamase superfamily II)
VKAPGVNVDRQLDSARERGIHRIALRTPFRVGRVNVYLVEDEPLTLVDAGPNFARTMEDLESGVRATGHRIEDIGLVVVTHQHIDHIGLVDLVARRAGAEVALLAALAPAAADYEDYSRRNDQYAERLLCRHGVAADVARVLKGVTSSYRGWGASVEATRRLHDGDVLELRDRAWRVLHRPGHSPSDIVLWDESSGVAIVGDHLLAHISSNPIITLPLELEGDADPPERPRALLAYLDSLTRTRELPVELVLAGHGDPITDHRALIDERLAGHEERAGTIAGLLCDGPSTAHELAGRIWGNVAVTQAFLTLSEVLGHLDLLAARGQVEEDESLDVTRFRATE